MHTHTLTHNTHMHTRTHTHTHTHTHTYTQIRIHTHTCIHINVHTRTCTQVPLPPTATLPLPVIAAGQLDAIVTWFDLHLDKTTSVSTAPSWDTSWEQAVFPVQRGLTVQDGDTIVVSASCSETSLDMRVTDILPYHSSNTSSVVREEECMEQNGKTEAAGSGAPLTINSGVPTCSELSPDVGGLLSPVFEAVGASRLNRCEYYVERSMLSRLNDSWYTETCRKALQLAVVEVTRGLQGESSSVSSSGSEQGVELGNGISNVILEPESDPVPATLMLTAKLEDQAFVSEGLEPENRILESDHNGQPELEMESSDYADCIVLDVGHGLSVFGLLAARDGTEIPNYRNMGMRVGILKPSWCV